MYLQHSLDLFWFGLIGYSCLSCCHVDLLNHWLAQLLVRSGWCRTVCNSWGQGSAIVATAALLEATHSLTLFDKYYLELPDSCDKSCWMWQRTSSYSLVDLWCCRFGFAVGVAPENGFIHLCCHFFDSLHIGHPASFQPCFQTNSQRLSISETVISTSSFCCFANYLFLAVNITCFLCSYFDHLKADCYCFSSSELVTVSFIQIVSPTLETYWIILTNSFLHLLRPDASRIHSLLRQRCSASNGRLPCSCRKLLFHDSHLKAKTMFPSVFSHYFSKFDPVSLSSLGHHLLCR